MQVASRVTSAAIEYLPDRLEYACFRSALLLRKSLSHRMWAEPFPDPVEFSPEQKNLFLMQLDGVGEKYCKSLLSRGIDSFAKLASTPTHVIDNILGRQTGFGQKLHDLVLQIPSYSLSTSFERVPSYGFGFRLAVTVTQVS